MMPGTAAINSTFASRFFAQVVYTAGVSLLRRIDL